MSDPPHPLASAVPDDTCFMCWSIVLSEHDRSKLRLYPTEVLVTLVTKYRDGDPLSHFCVQMLCPTHGRLFNLIHHQE